MSRFTALGLCEAENIDSVYLVGSLDKGSDPDNPMALKIDKRNGSIL